MILNYFLIYTIKVWLVSFYLFIYILHNFYFQQVLLQSFITSWSFLYADFILKKHFKQCWIRHNIFVETIMHSFFQDFLMTILLQMSHLINLINWIKVLIYLKRSYGPKPLNSCVLCLPLQCIKCIQLMPKQIKVALPFTNCIVNVLYFVVFN